MGTEAKKRSAWTLYSDSFGSGVQIGDECGFFVQAKTKRRSKELARLIAAAPDLLEAAELALRELENCYNVTDWPGGLNSSQGRAIAPIRAAITKAKGKQ